MPLFYQSKFFVFVFFLLFQPWGQEPGSIPANLAANVTADKMAGRAKKWGSTIRKMPARSEKGVLGIEFNRIPLNEILLIKKIQVIFA